MDLREIKEIDDMCKEIQKIQGEWDGRCKCIECYWNLWHPTAAEGRYNNEESKVCISENLTEIKMKPDTITCHGYLSHEVFCGHEKC